MKNTKSCKDLIRFLYNRYLKQNISPKYDIIVSRDKVYLNIVKGYKAAVVGGLTSEHFKYYCTVSEYLVSEGDFSSVAKER